MAKKEGRKYGMLHGFFSFLIIYLCAQIGLLVEQQLRIGFKTSLGYITGIPLAVGICLALLMTRRMKKQGSVDWQKFWLGFFIPLIVGLLIFGACSAILFR